MHSCYLPRLIVFCPSISGTTIRSIMLDFFPYIWGSEQFTSHFVQNPSNKAESALDEITSPFLDIWCCEPCFVLGFRRMLTNRSRWAKYDVVERYPSIFQPWELICCHISLRSSVKAFHQAFFFSFLDAGRRDLFPFSHRGFSEVRALTPAGHAAGVSVHR